MRAVGASLGRLWDEVALLFAQTGRTLGRLAAPVLGLMLLGWSANELSVLVASEVSSTWPWLVIVLLAVGMVLQLATILALLRLVAVDLGLPALLRQGAVDSADDDRDTGPVQLLTITLLPFLAIYATFGFVSDYASNLVKLAGVRKGYADFMIAMNPIENSVVLAWTLGFLVVGYGFKLLNDRWRERTRFPLVVGVVEILVEATLALLVLLVAFRIGEQVVLWAGDRVFRQWLDDGGAWLASAIHLDLPAVLTQAWSFWAGTLWPVLFDGFTRPLLWLAMAGLVFGTRVLSLADLWRLGEPGRDAPTTGTGRALARLREDNDTVRGVRRVALSVQEWFLGGVDETVLPAWQSLRLVVRAGWPFLGAFVIAFTLVDAAGDQLNRLVLRLVGGHPIDFWLRVLPLVDLVRLVLVMGVLWVLLAVAYSRALSIFAAGTGDAVAPVLVPRAGARSGARSGVVGAACVIVVTALVVVAAGRLPEGIGHEVNQVALLQAGDLQGQQVKAGQPRVARSIQVDSDVVDSDLVFVVVPVLVSSPGPDGGIVQLTLVSGERTYSPWAGLGAPIAPPGFRVAQEAVFEVDPADLGPEAAVVFAPGEPFSSYQEWVRVPLGLTQAGADAAEKVTTVETTPLRAAA
ncbi:MAG: hypothetical protein QM779_04455 [Propionicimonas sp.]|uniref:hypothetical protein n=1 Tax=Propionicimonas sp. TaxID=1955623 RepID=UPI003D13830B